MSAAGHPPADDHAATFRTEIPRLTVKLGTFLRKLGCPERHVEDLVQDSLVAIWTVIRNEGYRPDPEMDPVEALLRFAYGVAGHRALDLKKSAAFRREVPPIVVNGDDDVILGAIDPRTEGSESRIEARDVVKRLDELCPEYREVLALVGQGFKRPEIEKAVGANVQRRLRMAREALANRLDPGARRAVWKNVPKQAIKRQRGKRKKPEEDDYEGEVWPMGVFA